MTRADEARLRLIVREELARALAGVVTSAPAGAQQAELRRAVALLREAAAVLEAIAEPRQAIAERPKVAPTDLDRERARASLRRLGVSRR